MKRFRILINKDIQEFSYPKIEIGKEGIFSIILKLSLFIPYVILFLFIFLLPFSNQGLKDTNTFQYILLAVVMCLGLFLISIVLKGTKLLVDPRFFLTVLFFALLTTFSSVFSVQSSTNNTFGSTNIRGLSGLFIMCSIAIFYLINFYIREKQALRRFLNALNFGLIAFLLYCSLQLYNNPNLIIDYLPLWGVLFILLSHKIIYTIRYKLVYIALMVMVAIIVLSNIPSSKDSSLMLYYLLTSIVIGILVYSLIYVYTKFKTVALSFKNLRAEVRKESINLNKAGRYFIEVSLVTLPVIALILLALIISRFDPSLTLLNEKLKVIGDSLVILDNKQLTFENIQRILFGLGGTVLTDKNGLIVNLIYSQGLFGLIAYLFIFIVALYQSIKSYIDARSSVDNYLPILNLSITIFLGVMSIFTYPGALLLVIWWIIFSLFSAEGVSNKEYVNPIEDTRVSFKQLVFKFGKKSQLLINNGIIKSMLITIIAIVTLLIVFNINKI